MKSELKSLRRRVEILTPQGDRDSQNKNPQKEAEGIEHLNSPDTVLDTDFSC